MAATSKPRWGEARPGAASGGGAERRLVVLSGLRVARCPPRRSDIEAPPDGAATLATEMDCIS
ncbi:hypothetical protein E2C01_096072 [Portunus trituberculatus]|uniref:Uncharacterized protein n=1 Tax=Portunus trituberculatus TaxID=210409 RepID=A0A5B7K0W3_PORTR|nr:hypothetical protein [Portunus trituberculatus]